MFAFLRVIVFYLGFAALLTWAMFALGWADALELPGFEGTRSTPVTTASLPSVETHREPAPAAEVRPAEPQQEPRRVVTDVPPPAVRTEVAVARPVIEAPRTLALPPQPPLAKDTRAPEPVAAPVPPPPRAPLAPPPPAPSPAHTADVAPAPRAPVPAPVSAEPITRTWAPGHRIAGFGPDALVDLLGEPRRARDDVACVMFRNVTFKAGTTVYQPRARAELELIARILAENPGPRVELGSRLGPGRPMTTDAKLRTDRSSLVRENLIALGVAPARLAIDTNETYERVADDVGRVNGGRVQSIGVCLHAA